MNWFSRIFDKLQPTRGVELSSEQLTRLDRWQSLAANPWTQDSRQCRYLIVDVEASGLDIRKDRLISIGAVALDHGVIDPVDAFEVVLRQDTISTSENILIHGISGSQQREGIDPAEALLQFLEYSGNTPLVAYHAFFDQAMIAAAMKQYLGIDYAPRWLDLAWLMPALYSQHYAGAVNLDKWLDLFGIRNYLRHNAVSDCLATAQLLQIALQRGAERGLDSPMALFDSARHRQRTTF